ncbi:MAG: ArsR/SmtB family transcription factor [Pseudoramibacter sp.]
MNNIIDIFKALSNETRLNILKWLKEPGRYFPPQGLHIPEGESFDNSVCVGSICERAEISQSTISTYLDMMLRCGLLESKRCGKWTYYRRNEKTIQELARYIGTEL